jgi:hypothetical protein
MQLSVAFLSLAAALVGVEAGQIQFFTGVRSCSGSPTQDFQNIGCNICTDPPGGKPPRPPKTSPPRSHTDHGCICFFSRFLGGASQRVQRRQPREQPQPGPLHARIAGWPVLRQRLQYRWGHGYSQHLGRLSWTEDVSTSRVSRWVGRALIERDIQHGREYQVCHLGRTRC